MSAPMFEPLDLFDFAPAAPVPQKEQEEGMDLDLDAELALFEEQERMAAKASFVDDAPPDMEEEPDWEDADIQVETTRTTQTLVSNFDREISTTLDQNTSLTFGAPELFDGPIASCEPTHSAMTHTQHLNTD